MNFETQVKYCTVSAVAAAVPAGSITEAGSIVLDAKFKRAVGIKLIPIDNAGLTQFDVAIQHAELNAREAVDYRDWAITNPMKYVDGFKPINISASGTTMKIIVHNVLQQIALAQILRFQIVLLLTNDPDKKETV